MRLMGMATSRLGKPVPLEPQPHPPPPLPNVQLQQGDTVDSLALSGLSGAGPLCLGRTTHLWIDDNQPAPVSACRPVVASTRAPRPRPRSAVRCSAVRIATRDVRGFERAPQASPSVSPAMATQQALGRLVSATAPVASRRALARKPLASLRSRSTVAAATPSVSAGTHSQQPARTQPAACTLARRPSRPARSR